MAMFRNAKKRSGNLFSSHGMESLKGRGTKPTNRRARVLNLESLENRQLLSVSPGISADEACDLGVCGTLSDTYTEETALVSTIDPAGDSTVVIDDAVLEIDVAADDSAVEETGTAPTVTDDSFAMTSSQQLGAGVLANDVDADGDTLVVTLDSDVSHGQLNLDSNGLFTYRPDSDFDGIDSFTYTVSDGANESEPATVSIEVTGVENQAPKAVEDAYSLAEDGSLTVSRSDGLLSNDADAEDDPLYANLVDGPAHGTLTVGRYGSFTYTPDADFNGTDQFTYMANDLDGDSEPTTVTLTVDAVNDAPVSSADTYTTSEDTTLTIDTPDGVLANDSDVDGDTLTVRLVQEPSHGTVTLADDGSFEYTPEPDFFGEDSFTYVAGDGQIDTEVASVTIFVEAVNDGPAAAADSYSTTEDGVLTVDAADGVLANDTDVEGDALTATLVDQPAHGTVTLAEDGSFEYTPEAGFSGEDSFTYVTSDGQSESSSTLVAIAVEAINDAPVPTADAYSVAEDGVLTIDSESGVLANDTDADGDALSATIIDEPAHGAVTLAEDGSFVYTPESDFSGEDSFTYVAGDGQAESEGTTVAISVEAANDAPVSAADAYVTSEDAVLTVDATGGVLANDTDADADALTASVVDEPSHGIVTLAEDGSFVYTPEADFSGEDSFTYLASDGEANGELTVVTVTVEAVNDAPQSAADAYSTSKDDSLTVDASEGVLANDSDVEGDALSAQLVNSPSHGTVVLAEDGSFEYTPEDGFSGTDTFTYVTSDGQAESEASTVSVEVTGAQLSIQLQVTSTPFGEQVDTLWTDSTFWVSVSVEDLSDLGLGVIGGAIDLAYDASAVTPTGEVVYGDAFSLFQQGEVNSEEGLVDETGALTATAGVGAGEAAQFVSWQFTRTGDASTFSNGTVQFSVDAGEGTSTILPANFALTGSGDAVDWDDVEMGSTSLDLIFADFNGDQVIDHFDLALWVPHSGTSADSISTMAADSVGYQSMFDLDSDGAVDQGDLDLLTSAMYTLSAPSQSLESSLTDTLDEGLGDTDSLADLDSGLEGTSGETDPTLVIDGLFASDDLWA